MSKIGIILQARLTSSRFPNKMLCPLLGKPVLQWTLDECLKTDLPIVIAIPKDKTDVGLTAWIYEHYKGNKQIDVSYGSKDDLATRYHDTNTIFSKFDIIVRICGDNPFFNHKDVYRALKIYKEDGKYTRVNHIEVFSREELEYVYRHDKFPQRREHCVFMLAQTVDYPDDIDRLEFEYQIGQQTKYSTFDNNLTGVDDETG